ncbi:unnamed protein product [Ixodes pacificus]
MERNNLRRLLYTNEHSGKLKKYWYFRQITLFATAPATRVRKSRQRCGEAQSDLFRLVPSFSAWCRPFCWSHKLHNRDSYLLQSWKADSHRDKYSETVNVCEPLIFINFANSFNSEYLRACENF